MTADVSPDQTPAGWSDFAEAYDTWLAPNTRRFALDVADALHLGPGVRLIDVAAGTGALTLAAARLGADVLATDFAPGMVDLLRRKVAADELRVRVEPMDGQALDVEDGAFDAAASLFGLIFFPDTAAGARELHRVLRPGGRAAVTAWGPDGFAIQTLALQALAAVGVEHPIRSTAPAAFRLSDPARLEALLTDAGFTDVEVQRVEHRWPVPDPEALFRSIPSWAAPMRPLFARLDEGRLRDGAAAFTELVRRGSQAAGVRLEALLAIGVR
ncbi:class I SAM-dependent methyltransferase [uncultured Amnibacterium sp.]|uniref:class I SAM-dependent methyltransferase n=1 Tax=uncultured Amnibacterium sp. TaxID=1631851 RepID=UPI0035C9908C